MDVPKWMYSKAFRYGFLVFFFAMFFVILWNTYLVFASTKGLTQAVTLLWQLMSLGIGHIMETLLPHGFHSMHSASTAWCSLQQYWVCWQWFFSSQGPGVSIVLWEPWCRLFAKLKIRLKTDDFFFHFSTRLNTILYKIIHIVTKLW